MPEGQVLEFDRVTKKFGDVTAVSEFSGRVEPGVVTGFLGPNGAGKTTTLRMLLGMLKPTSGSATIGGAHYSDLKHAARVIGAMPEDPGFRPRRSVERHLIATAKANGIALSRVAEVITFVGLDSEADSRIATLSLGMRQRLSAATALLGDPGALVLDEPANGLDPEGIRWMRLLIRGLADEGRTVLVSSHVLSEVEQVADDILVIARGQRKFAGSLATLADPTSGPVIVDAQDRDALETVLTSSGFDFEVLRSGLTVRGSDATTIGALAAGAGVALTTLQQRGPSLEDVFLDLVNDRPVQFRRPEPVSDATIALPVVVEPDLVAEPASAAAEAVGPVELSVPGAAVALPVADETVLEAPERTASEDEPAGSPEPPSVEVEASEPEASDPLGVESETAAHAESEEVDGAANGSAASADSDQGSAEPAEASESAEASTDEESNGVDALSDLFTGGLPVHESETAPDEAEFSPASVPVTTSIIEIPTISEDPTADAVDEPSIIDEIPGAFAPVAATDVAAETSGETPSVQDEHASAAPERDERPLPGLAGLAAAAAAVTAPAVADEGSTDEQADEPTTQAHADESSTEEYADEPTTHEQPVDASSAGEHSESDEDAAGEGDEEAPATEDASTEDAAGDDEHESEGEPARTAPAPSWSPVPQWLTSSAPSEDAPAQDAGQH